MAKTKPITDIKVIYDIGDYLKEKNERDYLLYLFGLYTGPRILEYLDMRVRDVLTASGKIVSSITLNQYKTDSKRTVKINKELMKVLEEYVEGKAPYEYLFQSPRRGEHGQIKPITRQQAYNILSAAGEKFGVKLSPHSLRKTFGRFIYEQSNDITKATQALGKKDPIQAMIYIGVTDEEVGSAIDELSFVPPKKR